MDVFGNYAQGQKDPGMGESQFAEIPNKIMVAARTIEDPPEWARWGYREMTWNANGQEMSSWILEGRMAICGAPAGTPNIGGKYIQVSAGLHAKDSEEPSGALLALTYALLAPGIGADLVAAAKSGSTAEKEEAAAKASDLRRGCTIPQLNAAAAALGVTAETYGGDYAKLWAACLAHILNSDNGGNLRLIGKTEVKTSVDSKGQSRTRVKLTYPKEATAATIAENKIVYYAAETVPF